MRSARCTGYLVGMSEPQSGSVTHLLAGKLQLLAKNRLILPVLLLAGLGITHFLRPESNASDSAGRFSVSAVGF